MEEGEKLRRLREKARSDGLSIPDKHLLKFLRWKSEGDRAYERLSDFVKWRKGCVWMDSPDPLLLSRSEVIRKVVMSGVLACPTNVRGKHGEKLLFGRFRFNDLSSWSPQDLCRAIVYLVETALISEETQDKGVLVLHDLSGIGQNNISIQVPKLLLPIVLGKYPVKVKGIYIYNAPWWFQGPLQVVKLLMPSKIRSRLHTVSNLSEVHEVIDPAALLVEHGGTTDYKPEEWVKSQMDFEAGGGDDDYMVRCLHT